MRMGAEVDIGKETLVENNKLGADLTDYVKRGLAENIGLGIINNNMLEVDERDKSYRSAVGFSVEFEIFTPTQFYLLKEQLRRRFDEFELNEIFKKVNEWKPQTEFIIN